MHVLRDQWGQEGSAGSMLPSSKRRLIGSRFNKSRQSPRDHNRRQQGTYLTITSDTISASQGPMTLTASYSVATTNGNQISLTVSAAGTPNGTAMLTIDGDM